MEAQLIKNTENDLMSLNAARVSFDKETHFNKLNIEAVDMNSKHYHNWINYREQMGDRNDVVSLGDFGLINYLYEHVHFTPFTHSRITFVFNDEYLDFDAMEAEDLAGLIRNYDGTKVRHSLWGWQQLISKNLITDHLVQTLIQDYIAWKYPAIAFNMFGFCHENEDDFDGGDLVQVVDPEDETDPKFIDITMRENVPIFVARQRFKHKVGFIENEVSRRYVDDTPKFFYPEKWFMRPDENKKQGSSDEVILSIEYMNKYKEIDNIYQDLLDHAEYVYRCMIDGGVAPEQARMVLPQSMYTSYYVTGNISSWERAIYLRNDPHAQREIRETICQDWIKNLEEVRAAAKEAKYPKSKLDTINTFQSFDAEEMFLCHRYWRQAEKDEV